MARRSRLGGVGKLRRTLRRLPDDTTKEVRDEIASGAERIRAEAVARAPVGDAPLKPRQRGTRLKDNITAKVGRDGLRADIGVRGKRALRRAIHALFVEFGTVNQAAQPFLHPAFEAVAPSIRRGVRKGIKLALRRAVRG